MKTIYIDVYFLINFTVDLLALYFASALMKIRTTNVRLIIAAVIGGLYAVFGVLFIDISWLMYPLSLILLILMTLIVCRGVGILRMIKYAASFFLFQLIIGGIVYASYHFLDGTIGKIEAEDIKGENKNLIILSLIILLSIGVLRIIISMLGSARSTKSVKLLIKYMDKKEELEAFVDSGNLARDPLDQTPVMLMQKEKFKKLFGFDVSDIDSLKGELKRRVRIIPVSFGTSSKILYAVRADSVTVSTKAGNEEVNLLIASDDSGTYSGYNALIPLAALEDISYAKI